MPTETKSVINPALAHPDVPLGDTQLTLDAWVSTFQQIVTPEAITDPGKTGAIREQLSQLQDRLIEFQNKTEGIPMSEITMTDTSKLRSLIQWLAENNALSQEQTKEYIDMLPVAV